jgi:hypothetical protein
MIHTPERIRQRRVQMLVHSYLYYQLDAPIVSDDTWQRWADELSALQREHPARIRFYDAEFADWDGSTGMHLPRDEWVRQNALRLRAIHERGHARPEPEKTPPAPDTRPPALFDAPPKKAPAAPPPQMSLF